MSSGSPNNTLLLLSHLAAAALGYLLWSHKTDVAAFTSSVASGGADCIVSQLEWFQTAKPAGLYFVYIHILNSA
jgi:hypothetical protein